ncbi:MAG: M1 family metallopeptidase [Bryobacteraceae bacterium]
MRFLIALLLALPALAASAAAETALQINSVELDTTACFRVRDLPFVREDLRFYLTDGYLLLSKPVEGVRIAALFVADTEGGDAEVLLFPPNRAERKSLASFTETPNLNEHFKAAAFLFTDTSGQELFDKAKETGKPSLEMGLLLAERWTGVVRNLASSFDGRIALDLLSLEQPRRGFFFAAISGKTLGNFDLIHDPRSPYSIIAGRVGAVEGKPNFEIWTMFESRSVRSRAQSPAAPQFTLGDYRIDAALQPPGLGMKVTTRVKLRTPRSERAFPFDISRLMRMTGATIDGKPAEILERESLRSNLIRNSANQMFLLVAPEPLAPGREYEVVFQHEGDLIQDAGNQVYLVTSRGSWYPSAGVQFTTFDLTFRYPANLQCVAVGEVVADQTEGPVRTTRRRTPSPIRIAGFNLGNYQKTAVTRSGITVEVYANQSVERALQTLARPPMPVPPLLPQRNTIRRPDVTTHIPDFVPPPMSPKARLRTLAGDIESALEFFSEMFGPPPLKTLTVAPVPGAFGQGFPGLIYLSTLSYLGPADRPVAAMSKSTQLFFSDILSAHETAHQWWGSLVTSASYQDEWLLEALANYSALLQLERRRGAKALEEVLLQYRDRLLTKDPSGRTVESTGAIALGTRLITSPDNDAWRTITYEKGSWVLHMLRRRLGDVGFQKMLGELRRRFEGRAISIQDFRLLAAEFLPPKSPDPKLEAFFEQWVYSTGIPTLELKYQVRGRAPAIQLTGTIRPAEIDSESELLVPVEIQVSRAKSRTEWVRVGNEPAEFKVRLAQPPVKVMLDPGWSILAVHR